MKATARCLIALALSAIVAGCNTAAPPGGTEAASSILPDGALIPSPRLIVGRILAVDTAQGFAFVELASDAPRSATTAGSELQTRTLDLTESGRLQVSPYVRGRTLGAKIVAGQPSPGDEVVWLAP